MPSYDWVDYQNRDWVDRFPAWARGSGVWAAQRRGDQWQPSDVRELSSQRPTTVKAFERPRLFVSHRQADADFALRIAWLADDEGFDFWIDVLDPSLGQLQTLIGTRSPSPEQISAVIASIIEMGLINSTHVLAVMTENTRGSVWVPYEYGRVKEPAPITLQAGCWSHPQLPQLSLPEYLYLGIRTKTEIDFARLAEARVCILEEEDRLTAGYPGG